MEVSFELKAEGCPRRAERSGSAAVTAASRGGRLRILHVESNEDGTVGGSHRSLFELTRRLDRTRFEPIVLFYQDNAFAEMLRAEGVRVILFDRERAKERKVRVRGGLMDKGRDILMGAILRRMGLLRREGIDLVHLNNSPKVGCDDWLPACRALGTPIMTSVRSESADERGLLVRVLHRRFDKVVPVSEWLGRSMRESGFSPRQIHVVYNGVDVEGIRRRVVRGGDEIRRELRVQDADLFAVLAGNLRPWKGQDLAIRAVAHASREHSLRIRMVLAGDTASEHTDYEAYLHRLIREEGLEGSVRLLGQRQDLPELFAAADVAIHSSRRPEPFGLVVVEAMAAGTPVIASNQGGPREIIAPDSGFTHDPADPRELSRILARVARERHEILPGLRVRARERAKVFDIARTVRGMEEVYAGFAR